MPTLYGTGTTYTVTASNVISLYQVSTTTSVITATTYSTNLVGLYGGSFSALPTNAAQLIQLFDNNGNVTFYLDPITNYTTISATASTSTSSVTSIGNFVIYGNTFTNIVNGPFNFTTNSQTWTLNTSGSITLPSNGTINSNNQQQSVQIGSSAVTIKTNQATTSTSTWVFNNNGTTQFPNYLFPSAHGTAGQVLTDNGAGTLYWGAGGGGGGVPNQVFDFGTFLAPVSFTLDMGPFI